MPRVHVGPDAAPTAALAAATAAEDEDEEKAARADANLARVGNGRASAGSPIATGAEARLIEAEAALEAGDIALFVAKLNEARSAAPGGADLEPLTDTGSPDEGVDMLFSERGFLLFATGQAICVA